MPDIYGQPSENFIPFEIGRPSEDFIPFEKGQPSEDFIPFEKGQPSEDSIPFESGQPSEDFIPFESEQPSEDFIPLVKGQPSENSTSLVKEPPFLGSPHESLVERPKPLILDTSCITSAAAFRTHDGISGDLNEIHQTLRACLQVGRLERAAVLVRRLNLLYKPSAPALLVAHTEYMRELVWRITKTKDQQMLQDLQKWFEVDMRRKRVQPDTMTYALMIQASLSGDNHKAIARSILRYRHLAEKAGVHHETLMTVLSLLEDNQLDMFEEVLLRHFEDPGPPQLMYPSS